MSRNEPREYYKYSSEGDDEGINCCQLDIHKALIRERKATRYNTKEYDVLVKRSCTDFICILLFFVSVIGWIAVSIFVFNNGGPQKVLAPVDSNNRRCGFDRGVKDQPYIFFFDITKCLPPRKNFFLCNTKQVCVSECPRANFSSSYYLQNHIPLWSIKEKLICVDEFDKFSQINSYGDVRNAIEGGFCADWYMESEPTFRRCLPRYMPIPHNVSEFATVSLPEDANVKINGVTPRLISSGISEVKRSDEFIQKIGEDLWQTWPWIIVFMCLAVFLSFVYIIIMRWISGIMVWTTLFALIGFLCFSSFYTWKKYSETKDQKKILQSSKLLIFTNLQIDPTLLENDLGKHEYTWLALFIVSVSALILIVILLLFLRSRLKLSIGLIKEGSRAVSYAWSSLLFPLFPWMLQLLIFFQWACVFCFLIGERVPIFRVSGLNGSDCTCTNGYKEGETCDVENFNTNCYSTSGGSCKTAECVFSENEAKSYTIYLHLFNLLMVLWSEYFVSGFTQMSLAMTFAVYYWTSAKHKLPFCIVGSSVFKVIRYHLGTVAFGSFLLALLNWFRALVKSVYRYINENDTSILNCIRCCCGCFLTCLHQLLRLLTKNAYIMCAMNGTNYCTSAKHAFDLITRNILRASILDQVTAFLFFLMKLLITAMVGTLAYYFFSSPIPDLKNIQNKNFELDYYFATILVICFASYFISSLFFGVYTSAVDTIFLCALEDLERNDGSPEKPYAMSKTLMKVLKIKNKCSSS